MKLLEPVIMTDAKLTSTDVPEADYAVWSGATAYTVGQRVIMTTGIHAIFECLVANTNFNPATDTTGKWIKVSATNRWKAFDGRIGDPVVKSGSLTYRITPGGPLFDGLALFGLKGDYVDVKVTDSIDGVILDVRIPLLEDSGVIDWATYFYTPIQQKTETLQEDIPLFSTGYIDITVVNSLGNAEIGEIVLGRNYFVGETKQGSGIDLRDYSTKDVDIFGNVDVVERAYSQRVSFDLYLADNDVRRVFQLLARMRAKPAVYHDGVENVSRGTLVYGFYGGSGEGLTIDLYSPPVAYARLEIEGLT